MFSKMTILAFSIVLFAGNLRGQSAMNDICDSLAQYYHEPGIDCIYDTIIPINGSKHDSSVIFAIGNVEVEGIMTPYADVFLSAGLSSFKRLRRDTLLSSDCIPCNAPREFLGVNLKKYKGFRQLTINCSYFYNRRQMAGNIYRSFVYDITEYPFRVQRNLAKEKKLGRVDIGKISGE